MSAFNLGTKAVLCLSLVLSGLALGGHPLPASAQESNAAEPSTLTLSPSGAGLDIGWYLPRAHSAGTSDVFQLDAQPHNGYLLPLQTFTVRLNDDAPSVVAPFALADLPWHGELELAPELQPPALDWEPPLGSAAIQASSAQGNLPAEPLFLLRSGHARGEHIAVYGFSEIYQTSSGELRRVVAMDAHLPGAALLDSARAGDAAAQSALADSVPPRNPRASRRAVKVFVSQEGLQQIQAREMEEAGLASPRAQNLRVYLRDVEIPLHVFDHNRDGTLTGGESIRFYAPRPGDQWNSEDVYWLVESSSPGKRMPSRNVTAGNAPVRNTALETGIWTDNRLYESILPGTDSDNWFHAELRAGSAAVSSAETAVGTESVIADLDVHLPLAANAADLSSVFMIGVTAVDAREASGSGSVPHRLALSGGTVNYTDKDTDWLVDFSKDRAQAFERTIESTGETSSLKIRLLMGPQPTRVYVDQIEWQQPVRLALAGRGAAFRGVSGTWQYEMTGVPDKMHLYDVSDPLNPRILGRTNGPEFRFEDGPQARDYVMAGDGFLHAPRLESHRSVGVTGISRAQAVYIAPKEFHADLQPLLTHRREAGLIVELIDVQEIYDVWSFGFVDPDAIRDFLRHAVGTWAQPPIAAVLVGDGTHDPKDYLGFGNPNHIPPYLADVDPWINVTACENCYAQLNGDDPLSETAFLIDIWLGRFPVATTTELRNVVDKILRYEQDPNVVAPWRNVSVQLADDWIQEDGEKDGAGNFTYFIEQTAKRQPAAIRFVRHYYNALVESSKLDPAARAWLESIQQWIVSDRTEAQKRAFSLLNQGAGLVTFTGHSNHWAWARMGTVPGYEYRLFGLWDVLNLTNRDELFIGLSMTCLTAQFTKPESSHFTLDEHLVLHPNGGAIAMWGPSGLSVAYGHDALQTGFYDKLWDPATKPGRAPLGSLVEAGYRHVSFNKACCQDVIRTFLLLGDPLTPARVQPLPMIYMPDLHAYPAAQP